MRTFFLFLFIIFGVSADETILLSVGEQKEIVIEKMSHLSLGSDIVSYKYLEEKKVLLLKGKKIGHTNIIVWDKKKMILKKDIYCISKTLELKFIPIMKLLEKTNLEAKMRGAFIHVEGKIKNDSDYEIMQYLQKEYKKNILFQVIFDTPYLKEIIGKIYYQYYEVHKMHSIPFYCKYLVQNFQKPIHCVYESEKNLPNLSFLEHSFPIEIFRKTQEESNNYLIKIKIIQLQNNLGEDISLGPTELFGDLNTFFSIPTTAITQAHEALLSQMQLSLTTLGSTQMQIQLGKNAQLELGSEKPFQVPSLNRPRIDWKFSGLKMDFQLHPGNNPNTGLILEYSTELTQFSIDDTIEGHKGKSQIQIQLDKAQILFQIGLQGNLESKKNLPLLRNIPVLGAIFSSEVHQMAYKKVFIVAIVEKK